MSLTTPDGSALLLNLGGGNPILGYGPHTVFLNRLLAAARVAYAAADVPPINFPGWVIEPARSFGRPSRKSSPKAQGPPLLGSHRIMRCSTKVLSMLGGLCRRRCPDDDNAGNDDRCAHSFG